MGQIDGARGPDLAHGLDFADPWFTSTFNITLMPWQSEFQHAFYLYSPPHSLAELHYSYSCLHINTITNCQVSKYTSWCRSSPRFPSWVSTVNISSSKWDALYDTLVTSLQASMPAVYNWLRTLNWDMNGDRWSRSIDRVHASSDIKHNCFNNKNFHLSIQCYSQITFYSWKNLHYLLLLNFTISHLWTQKNKFSLNFYKKTTNAVFCK